MSPHIVSLEEAAKPGAGLMGGFDALPAPQAQPEPIPAEAETPARAVAGAPARPGSAEPDDADGEAPARTEARAHRSRRRSTVAATVRVPESEDLEPIRVLLEPRLKTVFDQIGAMRTTAMGSKLTIARALRALVAACLEDEEGRLRPIAFDHLPADEQDMARMWRQWLRETFEEER